MTSEELRKIAHEIPMNRVYETHTGRKFLGTHSMAWARASREWMKSLKKDELDD